MFRINAKYLVLFFLLLLSCEKEDPYVPNPGEEEVLTEFSFLPQHNPGLTGHILLSESGGIFTGELPEGARIKQMVASFKLKEGYEAYVGAVLQESGETANDFSKAVDYTIIGAEGDTINYEVKVDFIAVVPVIYLTTDDGNPVYSKDEYEKASVRIDGMDVFPDLETAVMKIRGRGHSTWGLHPKKPYQFKFDDKTPVLGMPEDKRWILLAEYSDKTFLRNRTAFELGYMSDLEWTPQCVYADVYLNDEFQGLYLVTQKVEESKNRLNITDDGYLLEIDDESHLNDDDVYFYSDHFLINVKEPEISSNSAQMQYIVDYIDDFEKALFGPGFKDPLNGYRKYIDIESTADWFLINEIAKNVDAKSFSSIYLHMKPGEKIKMGPLWDFDLGFGNVNYADTEFPERWWVKEHAWINRMLQDPVFVSLVKERYAFFRQKQNDIYEFMDEQAAYISHSVKTNDAKWQTIGQYVWPNPVVFNSYELELEHLKSWINERLLWMDGAVQQL